MTVRTIPLAAGGHIVVADLGSQVELAAFSGLGPASTPAAMSRDEAESVIKALSKALARVRGEEARPAAAVPLEGARGRKRA